MEFEDDDFNDKMKIEGIIPAPLPPPSVRLGNTHLLNYHLEGGIWEKPDCFDDAIAIATMKTTIARSPCRTTVTSSAPS